MLETRNLVIQLESCQVVFANVCQDIDHHILSRRFYPAQVSHHEFSWVDRQPCFDYHASLRSARQSKIYVVLVLKAELPQTLKFPTQSVLLAASVPFRHSRLWVQGIIITDNAFRWIRKSLRGGSTLRTLRGVILCTPHFGGAQKTKEQW